jgi:hypothetical protein
MTRSAIRSRRWAIAEPLLPHSGAAPFKVPDAGYFADAVQQAGIGFDKPQNLGKDQTGGHQCGPIWNEFMKVALKDQPNIDFAVPVGMSLLPTGDGAIEAYKPGQTPGAQTDDSLLAGASSLDSPDGVNIFLTRHLATLSVKAVSINRPSFDMRQ